jgi:hypothetical protein
MMLLVLLAIAIFTAAADFIISFSHADQYMAAIWMYECDVCWFGVSFLLS